MADRSCCVLPLQSNQSVPAGQAAPFMLNTRVDEPHRTAITGLAYHPEREEVASCSSDGEFKIWSRTAALSRPAGVENAPTCWHCRSIGAGLVLHRTLPLSKRLNAILLFPVVAASCPNKFWLG